MVDEYKLRSVADSWIVVVTIFLAVELTAITFTIGYSLKMVTFSELYLGLAGITVTITGFSMILFLAAKDPRMKKYSVSTLIDKGVFSMYLASVSGSILAGVGAYLLTELMFSFVIIFMISGVTSVMYFGVYRKFIHGQKIDS